MLSESKIKAYGAFMYWDAAYLPLQEWWAWEIVGHRTLPRSMFAHISKEIGVVGAKQMAAFFTMHKAQG